MEIQNVQPETHFFDLMAFFRYTRFSWTFFRRPLVVLVVFYGGHFLVDFWLVIFFGGRFLVDVWLVIFFGGHNLNDLF